MKNLGIINSIPLANSVMINDDFISTIDAYLDEILSVNTRINFKQRLPGISSLYFSTSAF